MHQTLRLAKVRKKRDDHTYLVETKMGYTPVGKAYYTVSPDRKTLTREGTTKHEDGQSVRI